MANTIYGPFAAINVVNGTTPANATWGNLVQTQSNIALHGFNPDLVAGGFVLWGIACAKDSVTANKLDIYAGSAYIVLTDGTVGLISVAATSQTTSALSSTYHLYLQPDGTFYWSTSNTPQTNSLAIATVTTDGSGNISGVTDGRVTGAALLPAAIGSLQVPLPLVVEQTQNGSLAGIAIGGPTFGVAGAIKASYDTAATFNGTTQSISVPAASLPSGNAAWSLECWMKFTANPAAPQYLLSFGTATAAQLAGIGLSTGGGIFGSTFGSGNDTANSTALSVNVWHHVVATWDGTTLRTYIDNVAGPTLALAARSLTLGSASLAATPLGTAQWFAGSLDECAFYGTTLSPTQVTAHFNAANSTTSDSYATTILGDSPLRYYRLGEAASATYAMDTISPTATTVLDDGGTVRHIAGQATAGQLGVSVPVAVAQTVHVTVTSQVTILLFTTATNGLYRISVYFNLKNATSPATIALAYGWNDVADGLRKSGWFYIDDPAHDALSGHSTAAGTYSVTPILVNALAGQTISVLYTDSTATPNDYVSACIEQLA